MKNKELVREAHALADLGYTRQGILDTLSLRPGAPSEEKVAEVVRSVPSLMARERFAPQHRILVGMTWALSAVMIALLVVNTFLEGGSATWIRATALALGAGYMAYQLGRYRYEHLQQVFLFVVLSGLGTFWQMDQWDLGSALRALGLALSIGCVGMGMYLRRHMIPEAETIRERYLNEQGETRSRKRFTFNDPT